MLLFFFSFDLTFLVLGFVVRRYDDIYLIFAQYTPSNKASSTHGGFRMELKLERKTLFKQTHNFCLSVFVFAGYDQSLQRESNFILFYVFNYVTYINPHALNPFIGKFRSSRRT